MKILVMNGGSSSLKYELWEVDGDICESLYTNEVKNIGKDNPHIKNHKQALDKAIENLEASGVISSLGDIAAAGHRVVHGGKYTESAVITPEVKEEIKKFYSAAPLHNPPNLDTIVACEELMPNIKHVAVFDTAFHQTMDEVAYRFPIPSDPAETGYRKWGFHGTSHRYLSGILEEIWGEEGTQVEDTAAITCHMGNGCSFAAIKGGKVIDTTMGIGPNYGLMMGTRSGAIDSSIVFALQEDAFEDYIKSQAFIDIGNSIQDARYQFSAKETAQKLCSELKQKVINDVDCMLQKESGLRGISGETNDMAALYELKEVGTDEQKYRATLALDMFAWRAKGYVGEYLAKLGQRPNAIVLSAGIGENCYQMREAILENMEHLGIELDKGKNIKVTKKSILESKDPYQHGLISTSDSPIKVYVIPTDENKLIAKDTYHLAKK